MIDIPPAPLHARPMESFNAVIDALSGAVFFKIPLPGTIGLGNIAGVAVALTMGGPAWPGEVAKRLKPIKVAIYLAKA